MTNKQRLNTLRRARAHLERTKQGYLQFAEDGKGSEWRAALKHLDALEDSFIPKVPALGPVVKGGKSVLLHDLTHATAGVPGYPAFDDGWKVGLDCIAPEDMEVTKHSGSQGGVAFFARGTTCDWWFGHISTRPPVGKELKRGERFGVISAQHRTPHLHTGINTYRLIGKELRHKTNYTHGAPIVGAQLRQALGE